MSNSAHFEHEAERTRAYLNDTVAELRSRLTVGQVADQVWELAKDGLGGDFGRNLARQAANNPMPVTLVGMGLAWLMFAPSSSSHRGAPSSAHVDHPPQPGDGLGVADDDDDVTTYGGSSRRGIRKTVTRTAHDVRDAASATGAAIAESYDSVVAGASGAVSSVYEGAKHGAESMQVTAASAYDEIKRRAASAKDMAGSALEQVKESAMQTSEVAKDSAKAMGEYASGRAQRVADFCVENPLVLIGAGVALGAIAGAMLPTTELENELMGEASDQVKQEAEHLAAAQVEKVQRVGEEVMDHIAESASREFAPDDVDAQIEQTGDRSPIASTGELPMSEPGTRIP